MNSTAATLQTQLINGEPSLWILVAATKGSVPRETGASMIVTATRRIGTIGGGHLELKAIEHARSMLAAASGTATQRHYPLGPALGQCCGGAVTVLFVPVNAALETLLPTLRHAEATGQSFQWEQRVDTGEVVCVPIAFASWPIWVFGAGHVGKAIIDVLATLPCQVMLVDERENEFPRALPSNTRAVVSDRPADEVKHIPRGAQVLVLTHSHATDLEICFALLKRDDLAYCGLIGSATKAATFRKRFAQRGISEHDASRIICPIGNSALTSKHPGMIAVGVAMDLALRRQLFQLKPSEIWAS
jgi:xanthine dehydrogenase accessory factor